MSWLLEDSVKEDESEGGWGQWESIEKKLMYGIETFVGFSAMNFGRTLVVLFQILPFVLGGRGCGRRKKKSI